MIGSLTPGYFDRLYADKPDPWSFETSAYERDKYADTLAALPRPLYPEAVEVGCSIGVLTRALASRCGRLLGVDPAEAALARARAINADRPNVRFDRLHLPAQTPVGRFDLIVFSEVLYYFDAADLKRTADWALGALEPGGEVLLTHWLGETPDYPLTGDTAAELFAEIVRGKLERVRAERREKYRLELYRAA